MSTNIVEFAKIGSTYSFDGRLKIIYQNLNIETLLKSKNFYKTWYIYNKYKWEILDKEKIIKIGNKFYIKIYHINSKESAKVYVNSILGILRKDLPIITKEKYYIFDLIDMSILNLNNQPFGKINNILELGAAGNVISCNFKNRNYLIPFINQYVKNIDFNKKQMIVDWEYDYI